MTSSVSSMSRNSIRRRILLPTILGGMTVVALSSPMRAAVTVVQQTAAAPTYATILNFDEAGGPVGSNVANTSWSGAPWQITQLFSGDGSNFVGNNSAATGQGTNSYYGPYGVNIKFSQDLASLSFQGWDSSGPPTFFGGGALAVAFDNGTQVGFVSVTPAWSGAGKSWYNITTDGGSVFDEIAFYGNGNFPESVVDNLSWTVAPEPSSVALLSVASIGVLRRRR